MVNAQQMTTVIIGALIALIVAVSLVPTLANEAKLAETVDGENATNVTGGTLALTKLLPLVFVAIPVIGALAFLKFHK